MLKKTLIFIGTCLGIILFFAYKTLENRPELQTPFPYTFEYKEDSPIELEDAQILVLGDQTSNQLDTYLKSLSKNLSIDLAEPINYVNMAKENYSLARTLNLLQNLKKIPKIIILYGNNSEFYEKRFHIVDLNSIVRNFALHANEKFSTLIEVLPFASRIFYNKIMPMSLKETPTPDKTDYSTDFKLRRMALNYQLFKFELRELIKVAKQNGSHLFLITTPLNLEIPPKETCEEAQSQAIIDQIDHINYLLKNNKNKEALGHALKLSEIALSNADALFTLGRVYMKIGDFPNARKYYEQATAFDCKQWRSNKVINNILLSFKDSLGINVIDFNSLVNGNLGRNALFINDLRPQTIYYEALQEILEKEIKTFLKL